jgi:solute carrier family 8 (sodium/calcium exchanger)
MGGWLCFTVAIIWIGVLTAVIGDVASAFGCSVGLKDSVTAIAFVAVGTSVPGIEKQFLKSFCILSHFLFLGT